MDFEKRNRSTVLEVEKLRIIVVEKCEIGNLDFVIERKSRKIKRPMGPGVRKMSYKSLFWGFEMQI